MSVKEKQKAESDVIHRIIQVSNVEQRWYILSIVFGLFLCIAASYESLVNGKDIDPIAAPLVAMILISTFGVLGYLSKIVSILASSLLWKAIFSVFFLASTNFALTLSNGIVNEAFEVTATPFVYTTSLVAIMLIPLFIVVCTVVLGVYSFFHLIFFPAVRLFERYQLNPIVSDVKVWKKTTAVYRYTVIMCLAYGAQESFSYSDGYYEFISDAAKGYAYNYEMEKYTHCEVKAVGEHFSYIDPNTVVVGIQKDDEYNFSVRPCKEMVTVEAAKKVDDTVKKVRDGFNKLIGQ